MTLATPADVPSKFLTPWAYLDGEAGLVYVITEAQTIDAIEIETGSIRWASSEAAMPIRVQNGLLLALRNGNPFQLVTLDTATGALHAACTPIAMPAWAFVSSRDGLGATFHIDIQERESETYLSWTAHTTYAGGVPPPPDVASAAQHHASGIVAVNATTCTARETLEVTAASPSFSAPISNTVGRIEIQIQHGNMGDALITARDNVSGETRWSRSLPSTQFHGPYPP